MKFFDFVRFFVHLVIASIYRVQIVGIRSTFVAFYRTVINVNSFLTIIVAVMKAIKNKQRVLTLGIKSSKHLLNKAKIIFFHGQTFADQRVYELDESCAMFGHPQFDPEKRTVLYIHGYLEVPTDESVNVVTMAYLRRNDHNVLVLDWSELADGNYLIDAIPNLRKLGTKMSEVVLDWVDEGLDVNKFHIVGHSLGAHMAGVIGRCVYRKSMQETKLVRISGLDPAFPSFFPSMGTKPVNKNDAEFVDIIHTDAWFYGAPKSTGTVDFWPNGGHTLQPGCPRRNYKPLSENDLCSHRRSWWFWAESVKPTEQSIFLAVQAKNWSDFKKGKTDNTAVTQMGIDCPTNTRSGNYFLQTNGCKPFAKGVKGLQYEKVNCKK